MDVSTLAVALGYTKKQIEEVKREGFKVQVEQDRNILETTGEEKIFYFLPKNPQKTRDGYDEFIYTNNNWEQVGVTDVDLNYELLSNKPQINGHTLSGDKTSDDLGLQKKLTAGQNITIANDGTISAEDGGVTSYNDLTDKPNVSNYAPSQREQTHPLTGTLDLYPFTSTYNSSTQKNSLRLDASNLFEAFRAPYTIYSFEDLPTSHGVFACYYANSGFVTPLPDFIKPLSNFFVVYNLNTGTSQGLAQLIFWVDKNSGKSKSAFRVGANNFYTVSPWQEIGGGSRIVSGVVNAKGTIRFTDSDGNTFITTGESVIGPQGNPGQDYVLTEQDKSDIADIVLGELPTTEGVLYGNTNN